MDADAMGHLASLHCGYLAIDPARTVTAANEVLIGWHGGEVVGRDLTEILAPGALVYWESTLEPLLEHEGTAWGVALELRVNDGTRQAVLVNVRRSEHGTELLLFPFAERRRYERKMLVAEQRVKQQEAEIARLAELEEFRRDFINAAAHELRTPMTPLQIQFHLLKQALAGNVDPKVRRSMAAMESNLNKLSKFTSDLLDSASVDAGHIGLHLDEIDLAQRIPKLVASWHLRHARRRNIDLDIEPARINADGEALQTCLSHLLDNAVKFSPPDSQVVVRVSAGPPCQVIVKDTGRGIEPRRLAELGRPFAQVHDRTQVTTLGAGLGLHIVAGLMKAQGGRLRIQSQGPGQGTTASLVFGEAKTEPVASTTERAASPSRSS